MCSLPDVPLIVCLPPRPKAISTQRPFELVSVFKQYIKKYQSINLNVLSMEMIKEMVSNGAEKLLHGAEKVLLISGMCRIMLRRWGMVPEGV